MQTVKRMISLCSVKMCYSSSLGNASMVGLIISQGITETWGGGGGFFSKEKIFFPSILFP